MLTLAALLLLPGGIAAADAHHTFVLKCGGGGFVGRYLSGEESRVTVTPAGGFTMEDDEEWTLDDAIPIMNMLFEWQYEKTENVASAQKYYTAMVNGKETKVWHTVTTCTVILKNKNLAESEKYNTDYAVQNKGRYHSILPSFPAACNLKNSL